MRNKSIALAIVGTLLAITVQAQKLTTGYLFPAGGKVGTTVVIEAGGLNINKAKKVVFSHPGIKGEILPIDEAAAKKRKRRRLNDQSSPQLADKVKIQITIDNNVPCGLYDLRLQSPKGLSNKLPFEVSSYPNVVEDVKRNSSLRKPTEVNRLPAVLCGYVTPGGVDYFRFSGRKGETLVASVKARQLVPYIADAVPGWFQSVIKIVDSKGKEVAYCDDYRHYVDPVIITTLPKDDKYTLIIHDAIYRGRQDFNYRIELGVIPFVTGRYPAYGVVGKKVNQQIEGANLNATKTSVKVKTEGYHQVSFTNDLGTSNAVPFYALPKGTRLVHCPKGDVSLLQTTAIADSLTADSRTKRYKVYVEEREELIVELIGRRNGSQIDAVIRLLDKNGEVVAKVDDTEDPLQGLMTFHADPVLKYKAPRAGEMILEVEDLHRRHGKDFHFLLRRHRQMPSFNAFVSPAYITTSSGGTSQFRVDIVGKMRRPANLVVKGLPKGFTTSSLKMRGGRRWGVSVTSPKGTPTGRIPIELKVEYPVGGGEREMANVVPVDNMMQAFYYTHHIPAAELALDIVEPAPYRLSLDFDIEKDLVITPNDTTIPIKILVDKDSSFDEPIEIMLGSKNRAFSLEPISIMPNEKEKTININLNPTIMERLKKRKGRPTWQMHIVGMVKGEIVRQGRRQFQNAKYSEMTPIFQIRVKKLRLPQNTTNPIQRIVGWDFHSPPSKRGAYLALSTTSSTPKNRR